MRCSECGFVFNVEGQHGSVSDQPWQIRTTDELLFTAPDLGTLRQWIVEGRLHPDDRVSRTGRHWLRLGDMPEFATVFAATELPPMFAPLTEPLASASADQLGPPPAFGAASSGPKYERAVHDVGSASVAVPVTPVPTVEQPARLEESTYEPLPTVESNSGPIVPIRAGGSSGSHAAASKRGRAWVIPAALGTALGLGVVFGVPSIRNNLFGAHGPAAAPTVETIPPELEDAKIALRLLDPNRMGAAEAALQREVDEGQASALVNAQMQLTQVQILAARAVELSILAVVDEESRVRARQDASEYAVRAARMFERVDTERLSDRNELKLTRALVRLVEGRPADEIEELLPEQGSEELRLLVLAAPMLRSPDAPVPENLIGGLLTLPNRSTLLDLMLALAHVRSGDLVAARRVAADVLERVPTQATARALRLRGERVSPSVQAKPPSSATPTPNATTTGPAIQLGASATTQAATATAAGVAASTGEKEERLSVDQMIERGCQKVEARAASEGVKLLLRAHDARPADLDILVCLGEGYTRLGKYPQALSFFERALQQSPRMATAVRGAAKASDKLGRTSKAVGLYRRLLELDGSDGEARTYIATHASEGSETKTGTGGEPSKTPASG